MGADHILISIHEKSSTKLMKNASILFSSKKNQAFYKTKKNHVRMAASHVTHRKHITLCIQHIQHSLSLLTRYLLLIIPWPLTPRLPIHSALKFNIVIGLSNRKLPICNNALNTDFIPGAYIWIYLSITLEPHNNYLGGVLEGYYYLMAHWKDQPAQCFSWVLTVRAVQSWI